jgi:IS5 family transposase
MRQISFSSAEHQGKKRVTRREKFLGEMEQVVPWSRLLGALEPHYPKGTRGRPPIGLERMLRLYFVHVWTRCVLQAFFCDVKRSANMYPACLVGLSTCPQP